jgi:hypothetical protein
VTSALAMPGLFDTTPLEPGGPSHADDAPHVPAARGRSATRGATPRGAAPPAPPPPPPSRTVVQLLGAARDELRTAQAEGDPAERFRSAHLGALRAAAAVLALRARSRRSSRPTDAWTLLASVAPEYGEWAAFFAAHSATRSAVEAGVRGRVSQRDADDMVRQADLFLALVTRTVAGRGRS